MRNRRITLLAALFMLGATSVVPIALAPPAGAAVPGQIVITEWMYNPLVSAGAEFVELTNIGGEPVDMAGYSFDDDSRLVGTVTLAGLGTLAPGETALLIEKPAAAFRADWGVAATVKIVDSNTTNLGRADEINIFNGTTLVDRLSYGDEATRFPGSIRTQGKSGVPTSCLGLGANNVYQWVFSALGDANASKTSVNGDLGSPGATPLRACGPVTIVGGDGPTSTTPLPCLPESASNTGPVTPGAQPWPGGASVTVADQSCAWKTATGPEGRDMSGLAFDPANPDVLYAAKNKNWVFRLVRQGDLWVPDTANGWSAGKQIVFPGGVGLPDSEGLTIGSDGALYVTTERDNTASGTSLNSVLRFDPNAASTTLTPTQQWVLTADLPSVGANLGFEGITFVPDTYLVQKGFFDQSMSSLYDPSDYPDHGAGLFFGALENDGKLYGYSLKANGSFHRVAVVDTGMGHVMDVQFDADLERIWALCDNTCSVSSTLLKVNATGAIVPDVVYARPADLPNVNIEGFALAPDSTCVDGFKEAIWADDGISAVGHEGHALYRGTFPCGLDLDLDQTLDFPALPNAAPVGTVSLHATASSGLPVSYSSLTPTICTVSGSVVTPKAAGTCTIEATQDGNADYNAAPAVSQSFTVQCQTLCLLNPTAAASLRADGSARVNAGGGDLFVNSNASVAATLTGGARVNAAFIGGPTAPGGFTKTGAGSYSTTPRLSAPSVDPLAGLAACPDSSGVCPTGAPKPAVKVGGVSATTIGPGVYRSLEVGGSGRLTLQPGVYVITGPVSVAGAGRLTGSGVTLYLACSAYPTPCAGAGASLSVGGSGVVALTAPSTGPFAGFSVVGDRGDTSTFTFSGSGSWTSGAIYAKAARFELNGSASVRAPRLVIDTLKLSGASVLTVG